MTGPFNYSAFGLRFTVDIAIPGLNLAPAVSSPDVLMRLGSFEPAMESLISADSQPVPVSSTTHLQIFELNGGELIHLIYPDETEFVVSATGDRVWGRWTSDSTLEDTATYLLGPVLGLVLRLRGILSLHAGGVVIDNRAVVLAALPGGGKSTAAAAFAKMGFPVLTDDLAVLVKERGHKERGHYYVQPGSPRIRLWPDSAAQLFGSEKSLPLLTPNWEKQFLDLSTNGYQFQNRPIRLAAVYVLGDRIDDDSAPFIRPLSGHGALIHLVPNTYANYLLDDRMRALEFEQLAGLVESVPIRQLTGHSDPGKVDQLCEVIIRDYRTL